MIRKLLRSTDLWPFLALLLLLSAIYLYSRSAALTSDGLNLAEQAEYHSYQVREFWNPRHLFWPVYGYVLFHGAQGLGYPGRSLELLQWSNALIQALCAALFYLLLRRAGSGRLLAWSLSLWLGISYCYWFFGTEVKFYPVTMALLVLAWLLLALGREQASAAPAPAGGPAGIYFWLAGVAAAAAILTGLVNALFIPAALLGLVADTRVKLRSRLAQADAFMATTLISWVLPVIIVGFAIFRFNYLDLLRWFLGVRTSVGYDVSSYSKNFALFTSRMEDMVAGSLYWTSRPGIMTWVSRNYLWIVLVIFLIFICLRAASFKRSQGFFFWGALTMIATYAAGIILVDPYNDYRYVLLVPVLVLVGGVGGVLEREGRRWPAWAALALALLLLWINWSPINGMSVHYLQKYHADVRMIKVETYRPYLGPRDTLIMMSIYPDARYMSYFLKVNVMEILSEFQRRHQPQVVFGSLSTEISYRWSKGEHVYLDSDVFDTPQPYPVWVPRSMNGAEIAGFFRSHYRLVEVCRSSNRDVLYRVLPLRNPPAGAGEGN